MKEPPSEPLPALIGSEDFYRLDNLGLGPPPAPEPPSDEVVVPMGRSAASGPRPARSDSSGLPDSPPSPPPPVNTAPTLALPSSS